VNDPDVKLLVVLLLVAGVAGGLWYFKDDLLPANDESPLLAPEPAPEDRTGRDGPSHPLAPLQSTASFAGELVALPDLDDSDSYFLLALTDTFGAELGRLLVNEALIDKFVATVDSLPRKQIPEKVRPVGRLQGNFVVHTTGDKNALYLGTDNYARYDLLLGLATKASPEAVVDTYRRFYPLLQESYERLGYPDAYFNDRVVEVIDHLLLTPTPDEPILLVQPHVLYEFADPELEMLSSGQKLFLRMGSAHAARIKATLLEFRARIATSADVSSN